MRADRLAQPLFGKSVALHCRVTSKRNSVERAACKPSDPSRARSWHPTTMSISQCRASEDVDQADRGSPPQELELTRWSSSCRRDERSERVTLQQGLELTFPSPIFPPLTRQKTVRDCSSRYRTRKAFLR